ncbi:MAG: YitT family protein [Erysipelotrichaceae bacterium]|nr:YitT family protein [Erysipelotrichaceae bacterium]MCR5096147.1 YitT family protein [Erysipelotrichaceae bacterium]
MKNISTKQLFQMTFWVLLSAITQAFALTSFSVPAGIYPSGVSGLSRLLSDILKTFMNYDLPYFYLYLIINIILAFIVFRHIGKLFTIFSLLQTVLVSLFASKFQALHILDDRLLMALFGGLINGFGVSLALTNGASSGGTDFLSVYFSNKFHRSMWDYVFVFNSLLVLVSGLLFGWETAAYSMIYQYTSTLIVNRMHKRYTHQAIIIVTKKPDAVIDSILNNVRHGITRISAKGGYMGDEETILYTVVNTFQTAEVVRYALQGDDKAFIETRNSIAVYGNYYQKPLD